MLSSLPAPNRIAFRGEPDAESTCFIPPFNAAAAITNITTNADPPTVCNNRDLSRKRFLRA
jgi:hypothetical protein